ncbi:thiolase family protein [Sulfurimonas sp. HSL3-7]|uniref:thiolase family protein n=1 Tax=Sulfonitrofixus jiaomeiensis TaxID=3131938 RepID=UPI0031F8F87A
MAIVEGVRSPIAKAGGKFKTLQAETLGSRVVQEAVLRSGLDYSDYDEVIIGNVAQPAHAANVARVIALKAGFNESMIASTVHRNCASGMEAITSAAEKILAGSGSVYLCGGVESMSNVPLLFGTQMKSFLETFSRARTLKQKLVTLGHFRPSYLRPVIGLMQGLRDPVSGLMMGSTAEVLAQDFGISREEQDLFALNSHLKAAMAQKSGLFAEEIVPIVYDLGASKIMKDDDGIRPNQSLEALARLHPFFDPENGTVTAGNSSQISDGAAALTLMSENEAKKRGIEPLGYLSAFAYAGLEPKRMGMGPYYATSKLFKAMKMSLKDIDLIEMNEAFSVQVLANLRAFPSQHYAASHGFDAPLGEIDESRLNVNGGAVALGHPVGMTGTRLVIHLLKELRRRNKERGLATLCIGGGQGASLFLEVV